MSKMDPKSGGMTMGRVPPSSLAKQKSGGVAKPTVAKGHGAQMTTKKMNTPRKKSV